MKTVFSSSSEVVHVFASRTQSNGRAGNVFFESNGNKIYSYGYHYLLAEFITGKDGSTAIYINDKGYSSSTRKHISLVSMATRQYKQFFYTDTESYLENLLSNTIESLKKAKKPEIYLNPLFNALSKYIKFSEFKGEKINKKLVNSIEKFKDPSRLDKLKEIAAKAKILAKKAYDKKVKLFKNGEIDSIAGEFNDVLRIQDGKILTSQKVLIGRDDALTMLKAIKANIDIVGYRISSYRVNKVVGDVFHIGCHRIHRKELIEVGEKLQAS